MWNQQFQSTNAEQANYENEPNHVSQDDGSSGHGHDQN